MKQPPETIYLIPSEDIDGVLGYLWCDDPAPSNDHDPAEAVEYVRKDKHDEIFELQAETTGIAADKIDQARQIIAELVEYAECNDPGNPHIGKAKGFLSGGGNA